MQGADGPTGGLEAALTHLRSLSNLLPAYAIRAAATLRLADTVAAGPRPSDEIASDIGADATGVDHLLRYLASLGIFEETAPGVFSATAMASLLRSGSPMQFELDMEAGEARAEVLHELIHTVRTGEAAFPKVHGRSFWEDLVDHPPLEKHWAGVFAGHSRQLGRLLAERIDWSRFATVVDVGGGAGALLIGLLERHPQLRGMVFELPGPGERARQAIARVGMEGRASVGSGSFFEGVPAGGDCYLLSRVLHDWNDRDAVEILRRCAEALGPGGRVMVVEELSEHLASLATQRTAASIQLRMMVLLGGYERTAAKLATLATKAGLTTCATHHLTGTFSVLELESTILPPAGGDDYEQ